MSPKIGKKKNAKLRKMRNCEKKKNRKKICWKFVVPFILAREIILLIFLLLFTRPSMANLQTI